MNTIIFLVEQTSITQFWGDGSDSSHAWSQIIGAYTSEALALAAIEKAPKSYSDEDQEVDVTYNYNIQSWALKDEL